MINVKRGQMEVMMVEDRFFLYDDREETEARYVSFMGNAGRYDLAIIQSNRFFGKTLVLDLQSNRFAIIGEDDLNEEGYLEYAYRISEDEAKELREFLMEFV
jgi:hypothetical protein